MVERRVPGPGPENNERLTARPYESDFARLPDEEVVDVARPGGGPNGRVAATNWPLVVIAAAIGVAFATFIVNSGWTLAVAAVLLVVGLVWRAVASNAVGGGEGSGAATITEDR
jgi:hypothetical protein